jgi:DNA-binding transcriptional ArsR family regulator
MARRRPSSAALDRTFAALADPTRRMLLERIGRQPYRAGDLCRGLSISRPAVSKHLRVLRHAGLVTVTPQGREMMYRVPDVVRLEDVRAYVERVSGLGGRAEAFKAFAEQGYAMTIKKSIHVKRPVETAFRVFTEDIGKWWPLRKGTFGGDRADQIFLEWAGRLLRALHGRRGVRRRRRHDVQSPSRIVFEWKQPDGTPHRGGGALTPEGAGTVELPSTVDGMRRRRGRPDGSMSTTAAERGAVALRCRLTSGIAPVREDRR